MYKCLACGYIYDPEVGDPDGGIPAGTKFEDIPDDWVCPICGVGKDMFEKVQKLIYKFNKKQAIINRMRLLVFIRIKLLGTGLNSLTKNSYITSKTLILYILK